MKSLLYIGNDFSEKGGRQQLSFLNHSVLKKIFGEYFYSFLLRKKATPNFSKKLKSVFGYIDGIEQSSFLSIENVLIEKKINMIFFDGSNFGKLTKKIKEKYPDIRIFTFFHNVESKFFLGSFLARKNLNSLLVLIVNYLMEKNSCKFSDNLICLNRIDSSDLFKIYKRNCDFIIPMYLEDQLTNKKIKTNPHGDYCLFVGGDFYANYHGIKWFVDNVFDKVKLDLVIIGRGMDKYKAEFGSNSRIRVLGEVESLEDWYKNCKFVIAPIFDGSGMKTKVAEALMYGKTVIGTPDAFAGYGEYFDVENYVCQSKDEFIRKILALEVDDFLPVNDSLREIYIKNFSFESSTLRFRKALSL